MLQGRQKSQEILLIHVTKKKTLLGVFSCIKIYSTFISVSSLLVFEVLL